MCSRSLLASSLLAASVVLVVVLSGYATYSAVTASDKRAHIQFGGPRGPVAADPPIPRENREQPCAVVRLIAEAKFQSYGFVERAQYEPPVSCTAPWSQIILELDGAVLARSGRATQFDRLGMLWLRGVEVLRLTTPEPFPEGTWWHASKDLTEYADLFTFPGDVAMMIDNIVNSQYTGVIHVNVSFNFYHSSHVTHGDPPPQVMPLRNVSGMDAPINNIMVTTEIYQENEVTIPQDTVEARLDVYASGHSCEEFWYTNQCEGDSYRELLVYVDGHIAGGHFPFPVIYTGGFNPSLWHPLTGIHSFDVPPYTFDLTPFLAWLVDGQPHNITFGVFGSSGYTWYLNGVLILHREARAPGTGSVEVISADMPQVDATRQIHGTHAYNIRGKLQRSNGAIVTSRVAGKLSAWTSNSYTASDSTWTVEGEWHSHFIREIGTEQTETTYTFPLYIVQKPMFSVMVDYARKAIVTYHELDKATASKENKVKSSYTIAVSNALTAATSASSSMSKELVKVWTSGNQIRDWTNTHQINADPLKAGRPCFYRRMAALNGGIIQDKLQDTCQWPSGIYVCAGKMCGDFKASASSVRQAALALPMQIFVAPSTTLRSRTSPSSNPYLNMSMSGKTMLLLRSPHVIPETGVVVAQATAPAAVTAQ